MVMSTPQNPYGQQPNPYGQPQYQHADDLGFRLGPFLVPRLPPVDVDHSG
jgi:hypothetical protein